MKYKKMTKSGGITVPSDVRRSLNLMPGDGVDIDTQDGRVVISAHVKRCFFCRSENQVVTYLGKEVCKECIKNLGGMINGD